MPTAKQWWRRAAAAVKDHRSLCLTRMAGRGGICNADMEMSIIRATSHDETCLDYKHARRVFALARASPSSLQPLMWSLARRATRTRSWPVALKSLLLAHGLLLLPSSSPLGRLPFDLSDFRSHRSRHSRGFSTFVRAYFAYLDQRSLFLTHRRRGRLLEDDDDKHAIVVSSPIDELDGDGDGDDQVSTVVELQKLLSLLMQIRPYGDGMDVGLILEAMDCAMIEIFDVYSGICNGIANFLVAYMGGRRADSSAIVTKGNAEETRRRGMTGIKVLRKAVEQSEQLSSYFDLCRRLGVLNAAELPPVERVPEEDIKDLEKLVMGRIDSKPAPALTAGVEGEQVPVDHHNHNKQLAVVVTDNWVVFEDEVAAAAKSRPGNPFLSIEDVLLFPGPQPQSTCASLVQQHSMVPFRFSGNLIDL